MTSSQLKFRQLISAVSEHLNQTGVPYALAGGLAASLYRNSIRATDDIEFIIGYREEAATELTPLADKIQRKVVSAREANLAGGPLFAIKQKTFPSLLCGLLIKSSETTFQLIFFSLSIPGF